MTILFFFAFIYGGNHLRRATKVGRANDHFLFSAAPFSVSQLPTTSCVVVSQAIIWSILSRVLIYATPWQIIGINNTQPTKYMFCTSKCSFVFAVVDGKNQQLNEKEVGKWWWSQCGRRETVQRVWTQYKYSSVVVKRFSPDTAPADRRGRRTPLGSCQIVAPTCRCCSENQRVAEMTKNKQTC